MPQIASLAVTGFLKISNLSVCSFPPDYPFVTSQMDWLVHSQWKQGASNTLPLFTQAPHPLLPSLEHRLPAPHPEASSPPAACSDSPRAARPYSDSRPPLRRSSARPNRCASGLVSYDRGCLVAGVIKPHFGCHLSCMADRGGL